MQVNRAYCFFEQSGVFRDAFIRNGVPAACYDISDKFAQTDSLVDLFRQIDLAYDGSPSIFDSITTSDFIMAFFPCTEFSTQAQMFFASSCSCYNGFEMQRKHDYILYKLRNRFRLLQLLYKFIFVCERRSLRMCFENPWGSDSFLKTTRFYLKPSLVDSHRETSGDFFHKPTAYWFINCSPCRLQSYRRSYELRDLSKIHRSTARGVCNIYRSLISPEYANNFVCDHILGIPSGSLQQLELF